MSGPTLNCSHPAASVDFSGDLIIISWPLSWLPAPLATPRLPTLLAAAGEPPLAALSPAGGSPQGGWGAAAQGHAA